MTQTKKILMLSIIAAITILFTAFLASGTEYENAWLYVFTAWIIVIPAVEFYWKKNKNK